MTDIEEIRSLIDRYILAVHTQEADDILPILARDPWLLSITTVYRGADAILRDFLQGGIRRAYSRIDLFADSVEIRLVSDTAAVAVFAYHTQCVRRETGEPFGIKGLETQLWVKEEGAWRLAHVHYSK